MTATTLHHLMDTLGYTFKDIRLLQLALTHRSAKKVHNERLEFLGDAVLGLVIAQALFQRHPQATEGALSHTRAHLVCESSLAALAQQLNISQYLRLGSGEIKQNGEKRPALLADALEAIMGAIYLDGGLMACERCILEWYADDLHQLTVLTPQKDAKTRLQEYLQAHKQPLPQYRLVRQIGSAHEPLFEVQCELPHLQDLSADLSVAMAKNRRHAEQQAAEKILNYLKAQTG